jgi:LIVCS family branched-chain amino acid:cation transporter
MLAGLFAAMGLAVVYGILAFVGATAGPLGEFTNGGQLLSAVSKHMFGTAGMLILGVAVLFACLTTAIGLTTACGEYFSDHFAKLEYNHVIIAVVLFSFVVSNVGLTQLLSITVPGLLMVYPVLMALVISGFFDKWFKGRQPIYAGILIGSALISIPNGLEALCATYGIDVTAMSNILQMVPLYNLSLGWVVPAIIGGVLGYIVSIVKK